MNIRATIFWILDFLKGSNVRHHLKDIELLEKSGTGNGQQLVKLLTYVTENVEFYRSMQKKELLDFPIVNKAIIMASIDDFSSEEFKGKNVHQMSTSGSTGVPFVIRQNQNKRDRVVADLIFANKLGGQVFGEKYLFIRATSQAISKLRQFKNNEVSINASKVSDAEFNELTNVISRNPKIKTMLAYASTYEELVSYLKRNNIEVESNLKTLFTSAAVLEESTKKELSKLMKCEVLDRYSNQECGVLAQSRTTEGMFVVNTQSYVIELLKLDQDVHVQPGEMGRIVITDLYNYVTPLIRYDTGDLGISIDQDMSNIKTLKQVEGRRADLIYDTNGNAISPHMWTGIFRRYPEIKQWQLIQETENHYSIRLNVEEHLLAKNVVVELLKAELGITAIIDIEYVNEIPVLESGKFKATIRRI